MASSRTATGGTHGVGDGDRGMTLVVGSRESQLAMWQSKSVCSALQQHYQARSLVLSTPIVPIKTKGDKVLDVALSKIGDKGLFTKELENSLLKGEIDIAVHSLKDMPTRLPAGCTIGAIGARADMHDAVIVHPRYRSGSSESSTTTTVTSLADLPNGAVVGTSSLRRIAQLKRSHPHLSFRDIRGNLNTRLSRLECDESQYDALVLAAAGIERLGWKERIAFVLPIQECLPAVGQGALAVECRENDQRVLDLLKRMVVQTRVHTLMSDVRVADGMFDMQRLRANRQPTAPLLNERCFAVSRVVAKFPSQRMHTLSTTHSTTSQQ
jgi:hydroxymethylbilane synthase